MKTKHFLQAEAGSAEGTSAAEAKKPRFCDKDFDLDTGEVEFQFGNGTLLKLNVFGLSDEIKNRLMLHGALQKVGDSYAGAKGDYTAGVRSAQDVIDGLVAGNWKTDREGEGKPRLGELAAAISRIKGISLEVASTAVEAADDNKRKEWRGHPRIKAAIAQIRADKAQKELEAATAVDDVRL